MLAIRFLSSDAVKANSACGRPMQNADVFSRRFYAPSKLPLSDGENSLSAVECSRLTIPQGRKVPPSADRALLAIRRIRAVSSVVLSSIVFLFLPLLRGPESVRSCWPKQFMSISTPDAVQCGESAFNLVHFPIQISSDARTDELFMESRPGPM